MHYQCEPSVDETIGCMAKAVRKITNSNISVAEFYTINEDAQTLNGVGAREHIVNVCGESEHEVLHSFIGFISVNKDPALPMSRMNTIDTGEDATNAIVGFMKYIKKDPLYCTGLSLDADGTNWGCNKGVRGRVNYLHNFCLLATPQLLLRIIAATGA